MQVTGRVLLAAGLLLASFPVSAQDAGEDWSSKKLTQLKQWVEAAPRDALPVLETDQLDRAIKRGDPEIISAEARELALRLAKMHLMGNAGQEQRAGWNVRDTDDESALGPMLDKALASDALNTFFAMQRPANSEYSVLRATYSREPDPERRATIARNMERWRWMPRSLGKNYVFVNAAKFEASLTRNSRPSGTWRIIVGKKTTPTPVFDATIEGVILNPWWEIPASIVRESIGSLVRRNPSLARARGYVWSGGRYRQRPGPNNALGLMKLVMPNPYSVYMHDTPNKELFEEKVRTFSHGCIRTGDALGFAATLLEGAMTREEMDEIIEGGDTTEVRLASPLPLYVTYFTAVSDGDGGVTILDDVYDRDRRIRPLSSADDNPDRLAAVGCKSGAMPRNRDIEG